VCLHKIYIQHNTIQNKTNSATVPITDVPLPSSPGMAARDVAQALRSLASAARGVAATTADRAARNALLDCAADVMDKSGNLIEETKRAIAKPGDAENQQRLVQVRAGNLRHTPCLTVSLNCVCVCVCV